MKKILFYLIILTALFIQTNPADAHVLVVDDSKTQGAILHITPDDNPIAGQKSTLYFDTQGQILKTPGSSITLDVIGSSGKDDKIKAKIDNTLATADYTFPAQGVYELAFTVDSGRKTYMFRQSQRVSRGISPNPLDEPDYSWAEIPLLASGIALIILGIVAFNRRKLIAKQSKF